MIKNVNEELKEYINTYIIPQYTDFDLGHNTEHVLKVIDNSFKILEHIISSNIISKEEAEKINVDMIYTIAAYHDIAMPMGRKSHHINSGRILKDDDELWNYFEKEELDIMRDAIEDHRASNPKEPRTIYGKIISEADRDIDPIRIFRRAFLFNDNSTNSTTTNQGVNVANNAINIDNNGINVDNNAINVANNGINVANNGINVDNQSINNTKNISNPQYNSNNNNNQCNINNNNKPQYCSNDKDVNSQNDINAQHCNNGNNQQCGSNAQSNDKDQETFEIMFNRAINHINEKYGENGYMKLWLNYPNNTSGLKEVRRLLKTPDEAREICRQFYVKA